MPFDKRLASRLLSFLTVPLFLAGTAFAQTAAEYNERGISAYQKGDFPAATQWFEKAYELAPDHGTVRRNLCNALQAQANQLAKDADFPTAVKRLEVAISVDPENQAPLVQLGSYYLRLDMVPEAIARLEEAILVKPGNLDAHEMLGRAYYEDNDLPSARAQWDYVLEVDPGRAELAKLYKKAFREEAVEGDFDRKNSRHFTLSFPPGTPYALRHRVLTILERAYQSIGRELGGVYPPGPIQVIIYTAEDFSQATLLAGHVGAVYDGKIRVPTTEKDGQFITDDELERRLVHEYVHVVVRHIAGNNVPWWLNEGLAEALSKDLTTDDAYALQRAYGEGLDFELNELESAQLQKLSPDVLRLAYVQAHATVDHLLGRYGRTRFHHLMTGLATGESPHDALQQYYNRNYGAIETEVARKHQ